MPEPTAKPDSARVLLRLPRSLHRELQARADDEGVSVNTLLVSLLAGGIAWKPGATK